MYKITSTLVHVHDSTSDEMTLELLGEYNNNFDHN